MLRVIATILRTPADKLSLDASKGHTDRWDSLAQLSILSALEQEFGVEIPPDIAVDLTSIRSIVTHLTSSNRS
ncbi:MAG: acyl carrier protein [Verrucomicrobiota bacterium]